MKQTARTQLIEGIAPARAPLSQRAPQALVTMPPYAPYIEKVLKHESVSGIRLNTVMPVKGTLEDTLRGLQDITQKHEKELWIDLKCRQLRVKNFGVPPFTTIELSHFIEVCTPCKAYFSDRYESATVLAAEGNKLIMQEGPRRVVGPGESVTIPHGTLNIQGYLTDGDKKYVEACVSEGIHNYMLSFVEQANDIEALTRLDADANIIAKIESRRGLDYIAHTSLLPRIMAARGDLYMELHWPHAILEAMENIITKDKNAIAASRILSSLTSRPEPSCEDLGDLDNLLRMGYKTVMFGDEICLREESILAGFNIFQAVAERYAH